VSCVRSQPGLEATENGILSQSFFSDLLSGAFTEDEVRRQMAVAIDWGRYAELYEFEAHSGTLRLTRPPDTSPTAAGTATS